MSKKVNKKVEKVEVPVEKGPEMPAEIKEMLNDLFGSIGFSPIGGGCGCSGHTDRPPHKDLTVIELNIDDMWKRASDCAFTGLQSRDLPVTQDSLLGLILPFGGPNQMRQGLRNPTLAMVLLDPERYTRVADLVNHNDPFVIVIRKGNDVWAVVNPLEDVH